MDKLYELKDKLIKELEAYSSKSINSTVLEVVDKLAHATKNVAKVIECEEGYSNNSYDDYSNARGRRGNVRRDSMGRYSRDDYSRGYRDYSMDDYSMDDYSRGYSRNDDMKHKLRKLMETSDDRTRKEIEQMLNQM